MYTGSQKHGAPEQRAFRRFLEWLDGGQDSGGQKYLDMRRRLVAYFDRKNCLSPDDLADETLSRVARRLEEQESVLDEIPARYCYIVARFVFLEYNRQAKPADLSVDEISSPAIQSSGGLATRSILMECLERCLRTLETEQRTLILGYYHGDQRTKIENRRLLAKKLGLSINAIAIRACRIRERLELCIRSCHNSGAGDMFPLIK